MKLSQFPSEVEDPLSGPRALSFGCWLVLAELVSVAAIIIYLFWIR